MIEEEQDYPERYKSAADAFDCISILEQLLDCYTVIVPDVARRQCTTSLVT